MENTGSALGKKISQRLLRNRQGIPPHNNCGGEGSHGRITIMESFFSGLENLNINAHRFETISFILCAIITVIAALLSHNITIFGFRALVMLLIIPIIKWIRKILQKYIQYIKNKSISRSNMNLTCYDNMNFTEIDFTIFHIFKKCNFEINKYYWNLNCDSLFFYTNCDPRDELTTLENVMKITKLRQFRTTLLDNYFKYCFYSYLTNENRIQIDDLLSLNGLNLGEINVNTSRNLNGLTPDIHITHNSKSTIIDVYNGSDKITIIRKLEKYVQVCNEVYVLASGMSTVTEEFILEKENMMQFKLFRLNEGKLEEIQQISFGAFNIKICDLNTLYLHHYSVFYSEVYYWLHCDAVKQIVRTHENNSN
jgi:hypothetical protein